LKALKIKTKITLVLITTLFCIFGIVTWSNSYLQSKSLNEMYRENVEALSWSFNHQLNDIMVNAENEKIQPLADELVQKHLLSELTIINADKIVAHSSNHSIIDKQSTDPIWAAIFADTGHCIIDTVIDNEPLQISYIGLRNGEACADCHDGSAGAVLGGIKMALSKRSMAEAITAGYRANVLLFIGGGLLVVLIIIALLKLLVFTPLNKIVAGAKTMNQEFTHCENVIEAISNNDLTCKITDSEIEDCPAKNDEIGAIIMVFHETRFVKKRIVRGLKRMVFNLRGILCQLDENAHLLSSAAAQISAASIEMASGARNQSENTSQVMMAIGEMGTAIEQSTQNTHEARQLAENTASVSQEGQNIVGETIEGMVTIAESARQSGRIIHNLAESSDRIGQIIGVINEIADQTNLLALNAAIEAARAGEQGRGFAVVADEVRKLAERTSKATDEITGMIKTIQAESTLAVESMDEASRQVEAGKALADRGGSSLIRITELAQQVRDMTEQIAAAAQEQTMATEQIAKNVEHITLVTKETADGAEQSASAAEDLNRQAEGLQKIVRQFTLN